MSRYPEVRLKPGRNASIVSRHPWIFSGAIASIDEHAAPGSLVSVIDSDGAIVATGGLARGPMITVRVFDFDDTEINVDWLRARISESDNRRRLLGYGPGTGTPPSGWASTTGYRVVFGESDSLPGIVIDRYEDTFVVQLATAAADRLRNIIVEALVSLYNPPCIYEKSDSTARDDEGLEPSTGTLIGDLPEEVTFLENGQRCLADIREGQKTGFFLDQKDLRHWVRRLSDGRRVLDLFSYTGATATSALLGCATSVHCVDSSSTALTLCRRHAELNDLDPAMITTETADVFQWLGSRSEPEYDMVLLDPPALIKSARHGESGRKGYHFLNRAAMRLINDDGLLITSSCSAHFSEEDFITTLRRAADQANVDLHLLTTVHQSPDHPVSLTFPEASYLKSFICHLRR